MKTIIRKLYIWAFTDELLEIKKYVKRDPSGISSSKGLVMCGEIEGAIYTLETLDLLL